MEHKKTGDEIADDIKEFGKKATYGITIPLFLFVIGIFTMPVGLIFWAIAVIMFLSTFSKSIEQYANSKRQGDEENRT